MSLKKDKIYTTEQELIKHELLPSGFLEGFQVLGLCLSWINEKVFPPVRMLFCYLPPSFFKKMEQLEKLWLPTAKISDINRIHIMECFQNCWKHSIMAALKGWLRALSLFKSCHHMRCVESLMTDSAHHTAGQREACWGFLAGLSQLCFHTHGHKITYNTLCSLNENSRFTKILVQNFSQNSKQELPKRDN